MRRARNAEESENGRGLKIIRMLLIVLVFAIPIGWYATTNYPADVEYNRTFNCHVTMAMDQASLGGMVEQIEVLWENMNTTFDGYDLNTTYSTWWGPDQNYENSLGAQRDYFRNLVIRIRGYEATYANMTNNNTSPILVNDWYAQAVRNTRGEMNRSGGLDWAIEGAFYLHIHPLAYWTPAYVCPTMVILVLAAIWVSARISNLY